MRVVDNRRVVLIPLVKVSEYDQGRDTVKFFRFGAFFLKTKAGGGNGGEFKAEYIEDRLAIGEGGYNPTGVSAIPAGRSSLIQIEVRKCIHD